MGRQFEVRKASMAKTADRNSKIYSKYGKQLYVLAKSGGADPVGNLALRSMIERAKRDQVPTHVIEKALDKAKGTGGEDYSSSRYEGYGPGGCCVIVECLTDNANRTITDVRNCFTKTQSKMGLPGSVAHLFEHLAVFSFAGTDGDHILESLLTAEVDVNDVECENGKITVFAPSTEYGKARQALQELLPDIKLDFDEVTFIPFARTEISGDDVAVFEKFITMLEDCEDVQDIYHNATLPESSES